ncbi:ABC transporter ATP-binding protein [Variovorax sp. RHLX14]|uniref:ABC transporter ATP-binding protein n=1 Tax=Variovorax sp. RHLX14 TaxID=1259731 RepID=UPI003F47125D
MTASHFDLADEAAAPLLEIRDLHTHFFTPRGVLKAVNGVSLSVRKGEILAVVGESGCGKSVTAFSVLQLIAQPPGRIVGGQIMFEGRDLLRCTAEEMRAIRGNGIAMIFQEPMTSLNPVLTIGEQVAETLILHQKLTPAAARERVVELLSLVRMSAPRQRIDQYPHELSGGMRQRVMIAMALACEPKLLIADEPTTALDVTVQAQILDLLLEMRDRLGMAIVLITHDLGVVAETADRVAVMYAGRKIEEAPVLELFRTPQHPYTQGLIRATPGAQGDRRERLVEIRGMVPPLDAMPPGCTFAPRCDLAVDACKASVPPLEVKGPLHEVACLRAPMVRRKLQVVA